MSTSPSVARQLLALMTEQLNLLESVVADLETSLPDLNEPFTPSSETFRRSPVAERAAKIASAAAFQFATILNPPQASLYQVVGGVSPTSHDWYLDLYKSSTAL